jgi:hypothetical protein
MEWFWQDRIYETNASHLPSGSCKKGSGKTTASGYAGRPSVYTNDQALLTSCEPQPIIWRELAGASPPGLEWELADVLLRGR